MGEVGFIKVTETKATTKEGNERIVTSRRTRRNRERERELKKKGDDLQVSNCDYGLFGALC